MIWQSYELDDTLLKANETIVLWKSERGSVQIDKDTLAITIKSDDIRRGYVFHGTAKLVLDAIVETEEGAVGKSIEKEIDRPLLMLGNIDNIQTHLGEASNDDLARNGYRSVKDFIVNAECLFSRFLRRKRMVCCTNIDENGGTVLAFPNEAEKLDVLVLSGPRVVYKTVNMVFVSSKNKTILKTPDHIVLSTDRRSFIIDG